MVDAQGVHRTYSSRGCTVAVVLEGVLKNSFSSSLSAPWKRLFVLTPLESLATLQPLRLRQYLDVVRKAVGSNQLGRAALAIFLVIQVTSVHRGSDTAPCRGLV